MKYLIWLSSDCTNLEEIIDALKTGENDIGLLLIQDGVFMADRGCPESDVLVPFNIPIFALQKHVEERGISERLIDNTQLIDYPKLMDLLMEKYDKIISL
jgi:sulfur relay protein TusB/DsrH